MLEPATPNLIPDCIQPPPPPIIVNDELELKSPKSSTPRLTTIIMPASYGILSIGQVMRALAKKLPGSLTSELRHASELVADFHSAYPAKSGPLSNL